jgi:hypothetical protein
MVIKFIGYVACFWGIWKVFDYMLKMFILRNAKDENTECVDCVRRDNTIERIQKAEMETSQEVTKLEHNENKLKEENRQLREAMDSCREETEALKKFTPTLNDVLNKSSFEELTGIPGIGRIKANNIIEGRPYNSSADVYGNLTANDVAKVSYWYTRKYGNIEGSSPLFPVGRVWH